MAFIRSAEAEWNGNLAEGSGRMRVESGSYDGAYSFVTRFGDEPGTNPEELIAAAHAGCFTMSVSARMTARNITAGHLETTAKVTLGRDDVGSVIERIELVLTAERVEGLDDATFEEVVLDAKEKCPVSRALAGVAEITLEANLTG